MDYSVNINVFQGPFELLYHLIEKKEIDIYDIPISEITDQYLEYLEEMMQFNMNVASEFILMAASLIEIKSQMLFLNIYNALGSFWPWSLLPVPCIRQGLLWLHYNLFSFHI
jgi:hypothetical protein